MRLCTVRGSGEASRKNIRERLQRHQSLLYDKVRQVPPARRLYQETSDPLADYDSNAHAALAVPLASSFMIGG